MDSPAYPGAGPSPVGSGAWRAVLREFAPVTMLPCGGIGPAPPASPHEAPATKLTRRLRGLLAGAASEGLEKFDQVGLLRLGQAQREVIVVVVDHIQQGGKAAVMKEAALH